MLAPKPTIGGNENHNAACLKWTPLRQKWKTITAACRNGFDVPSHVKISHSELGVITGNKQNIEVKVNISIFIL